MRRRYHGPLKALDWANKRWAERERESERERELY